MKYSQYIDGEFCSGTGGVELAVVEPATGQEIGRYQAASQGDIEQAINCAHRAFSSWCKTGPTVRSELLRKVAQELRLDRDQLSRQITNELGKPVSESQKEVEVAAARKRQALPTVTNTKLKCRLP